MQQKYRVAVLGCGAIFNRHAAAIVANSDHYELIGLYDPKQELARKNSIDLNVKNYSSETELFNDETTNCVVILSPNNLHFTQAIKSIEQKKHVILEKPATFTINELKILETQAQIHGVDIFCILQVRLNPAVQVAKMAIESGMLGEICSVALVQKWQRPLEYFSGWRGSMASGGGVLREFAIHYLDAMQLILAQQPKVVAANFFKHKFKNTDVADTIQVLLNFGDFGGVVDVSVAAEPKNIECSLAIMTKQGFLKLGGKSLDQIIAAEFLTKDVTSRFQQLEQQFAKQGDLQMVQTGASPYHPELYHQIIVNKSSFMLRQTANVITLIEQIYNQQ